MLNQPPDHSASPSAAQSAAQPVNSAVASITPVRPAHKINLCNVWVDRHSLAEAVTAIVDRCQSGQPPAYVTPNNTQCTVVMQWDTRLRQIYNQAFLTVPDGVPLLWAAQLLRTPLNGRVNGTDLMEHLCAAAAQEGLRIFFLGGRPGSAAQAAEVLRSRYPGINITGVYCPDFGFEKDPAVLAQINDKIRAAHPHLLFVGLGVPKQEYWMAEHHQAIQVPVSMAVGGSFEMVSGLVERAPQWMQKSGLEWLFRLVMEPGRLWKRYLVCNTLFIWLIIKQRLGLLPLEEKV